MESRSLQVGRPCCYSLLHFILLFSVQNLDPCACDCEDCSYFFRAVLTIGVGGLSIAGCFFVLFHYFYFIRKPSVSHYEEIGSDGLNDSL